MKRFALLAVAAFVLIVPAAASAQAPLKLVYRPELRGMIPVPQPPAARAVLRTAAEEITRHEAMAQGYRGTRIAQAAVHCDRLVTEAREAARRER